MRIKTLNVVGLFMLKPIMYTMLQIIFVLIFLSLTNCSIRQGLIPFKEGSKYGFKTLHGQILIEPQYDCIGWGFVDGYMNVRKNSKWGIINEKGKLIAAIKYDYIDHFSKDGLAPAKLNGLFGFIDNAGKEIIPFIYE